MKKKQKILFIINPISGVGSKKLIEKEIVKTLDKKQFEYSIAYTKAAKHAIDICKKQKNNYDIIVAAGGDGTVNEVSQELINSNTALAIIPTGSGNGLARDLKIPLNIKKAIKKMNENCRKKIDTITINGRNCINIAGAGFDAHISHLFANYGKRGFLSYLKLIIKEFSKFKPVDFHLKIDDKKMVETAFLISFANSTQFGNNGHIAPNAKLDDGIIDIAILKKFPLIAAPVLAIRLLNNNIDKSKYFKQYKASNIALKNAQAIKMHIDGEPVLFENNIEFNVKPLSLSVIV